jgi:hypothetical protein
MLSAVGRLLPADTGGHATAVSSDTCASTKAGAVGSSTRDVLVATCRARPVVWPPVVETADPEYRVLMNAGKAPPAVADPIRRPATFGSGSPVAVPLRPAKRGSEGKSPADRSFAAAYAARNTARDWARQASSARPGTRAAITAQ